MLEFKQKYLNCLCADLKNELDLWDNLSLGIHSADLVNRHKARTPSPLSLCRFTKNYESNTANTSIVIRNANQSAKNPSLRDSLSEVKTAKQSKNSPSLAKNTPPQPLPQGEGLIFDSPSLACGDSESSLSLAEGNLSAFPLPCGGGLRGRVDSKKFHSIYIGGGTPNALNPHDYEKIFEILRPKIAPHTEITMELNPNVSSIDSLKAFKDLGVNRFSIGVQSFCDDKLKLLERNHSPKIARKFIESALKCGVKTSIDLIYGTILDSSKLLRFELENAVSLGVGHISCYALSIDKHSAFFRERKNPTRESSLCYELKEFLDSRGFLQYEVSNFARDDSQKSRHNLGYWAYRDYIGVGLGAVGKRTRFDSQGDLQVARIYKQSDFGAYLANPLSTRREFLSESDIRLEKIFLGFRSEVGVNPALITNQNRLKILRDSDKIHAKNGKIHATNYFIADEMALFVS